MPPKVAATAPERLAEGYPVQFVNVPEVGVPRSGVVSVGDVASTTDPVPVEAVVPVPPLATASVPANVIAPVLLLDGVNPVVPALNEVTHVGVSVRLAVEYHCAVLDALNDIHPLTATEMEVLTASASMTQAVAG